MPTEVDTDTEELTEQDLTRLRERMTDGGDV